MQNTYLIGSGRKKNGAYYPELSKKVKKSWVEWVELSEAESADMQILVDAGKIAIESKGNLPRHLDALAYVNRVKDVMLDKYPPSSVIHLFMFDYIPQ